MELDSSSQFTTFNGLNATEHATRKAGEAIVETVFADGADGPVPVPARRDHELDFVGRLQHVQVRPPVAVASPRCQDTSGP